jgi:hypothetical protein
MRVLEQRSLLTVDNRNKLRMHDLLRDMGRQIVYEESPFDPENRSRLWRHEEVFDILSKNKVISNYGTSSMIYVLLKNTTAEEDNNTLMNKLLTFICILNYHQYSEN